MFIDRVPIEATRKTERSSRTEVSAAFAKLRQHRLRLADTHMRDLFAADPTRFSSMSAASAGLMLDYSKNILDSAALDDLIALAADAGVEGKRDLMFDGAPINNTEGRSVLHVALRARDGTYPAVNGADINAGVQDVLVRMSDFSDRVRSGDIRGSTGKKITDVVSIGIGGSDLGPRLVTRALRPFHDGPKLHFVSNVDGEQILDVLAGLAPATTLFIVSSKTFTTIETMTNATRARNFIRCTLGEAAVAQHFAAVTTNIADASAFGILPDRCFGFWDWVGGRYSVWSAIGLPVMLAIGAGEFRNFLNGGRDMDLHFQNAPLKQNLPVLLAMVGIWYRNFFGMQSMAVLPYAQRLEDLPAFLQQLDMESNGKGVDADGDPVEVDTAPVVWGSPGTNGQHAFFQMLHQGTTVVPCDFIVGAQPHASDDTHHKILLANCFAQSQALMLGQTRDVAHKMLASSGLPGHQANLLASHKTFLGNRPSNTILYQRLTPHTLGALLSLYEHKVFVQGVVWGLNSFDQWGVELGKKLSKECQDLIEDRGDRANFDSSTIGLVEAAKVMRQ